MLLYGKPVAEALRKEQAERIAASQKKPHLAIIQAGDDLASATYIKMKQRYGESIGATVDRLTCANAAELHQTIRKCNEDDSIDGLIIQLPLPDPSDTEEMVALIQPEKDVDGLGPFAQFRSATAMAVIKLLEHYEIKLDGADVALVGYGRLVGKPLHHLLIEREANVKVCDISTAPADLAAATRRASVIISATGQAGLIAPDMVTDGSVVIDVGTAEDSGAIVGDTDPALQDNPKLKITPPKGGVGPITVAMLFEQLLQAAEIK